MNAHPDGSITVGPCLPSNLSDAHQEIRDLLDLVRRLRTVNEGAIALAKQSCGLCQGQQGRAA